MQDVTPPREDDSKAEKAAKSERLYNERVARALAKRKARTNVNSEYMGKLVRLDVDQGCSGYVRQYDIVSDRFIVDVNGTSISVKLCDMHFIQEGEPVA